MKKLLLIVYLLLVSFSFILACDSPSAFTNINQIASAEYTLVVEGFDWGAAASKVILPMSKNLSAADGSNFEVEVKRSTECGKLSPAEASGKLRVLYAYVSDAKGNRVAKGEFISLVLYAAPFEQIGSPIKYFPGNQKCSGNQWIDFQLTITDKKSKQVWNKEKNRIMPLIDEFDLTGKFTHKDISLTYASYSPIAKTGKRPLIIWLHGGGEGGTDPSIPLIANRAANYASVEMQSYFGGAYILVPQTPSFWMDNGKGQYTRGEVNDAYNESLMALIKDYVDRTPEIDKDRIYVGGCSNGGYMSLKLLLLHPDYFAAAFPSALAYHAKHLKAEDVQRIKHLPIWFIHSKDDPVTRADDTAVPVYKKLMAAGAENVHFSLYEHVVDITNQFGGDNFHYLGHFSWIYSHANKCQLDYDGKPVEVEGQPVTLMGWMARQKRASN
ncbi:MAG: prolyl oligopeptidase family serine peptidase [Bacteroidota bacterium]